MKISPSALAEDVRLIRSSAVPPDKIRVAAYCRVSTDLEIQQHSLDIQIAAYNRIIREHPGWELAGIYADRGISGTSVRRREKFLQMIEDAKAGKIQVILAKSISRFARNTVDVLTYVRELKECGVSVFFEKERLDTGSSISEFLLSIFAANAQEEIISLSANMKVSRRMRYAAGIPQWTRIYGYRSGADGRWIPQEKEAAVVRRIFGEYLEGKSLPDICRGLEREKIPSPAGKAAWTAKELSLMLHNEKYMGDIRMQKTYVSDPIRHTLTDNRDAKICQYYKENHHPAVVSREDFRLVQQLLAMQDRTRGIRQFPYYGLLKCPLCGANMVRFSLPRKTALFAWTCGGRASPEGNLRQHRSSCPPFFFIENYLDRAFREAWQQISPDHLEKALQSPSPATALAARELLRLRARPTPPDRPEYAVLYRMVQDIRFPRWDRMEIRWKTGICTGADLRFRKAGDHPFPSIERKPIEHTTRAAAFVKETYVINGVPLIAGCPDRQVEGIQRTRETVQALQITDPKPYEADVPGVRMPKQAKKKRGTS